MYYLGQSAFLKALGWALLNSFWQFGLLWIVLVVFIKTQKKLSPLVKHGIALSMISLGFIWFAADLSDRYFYPENEGSSAFIFNNGFVGDLYFAARNFLESKIEYISFVYLLAVAALSVKFIRYFRHSKTLRSQGLSKLSVELRMYVKQLVQQLNIRRNVQVWVSEYVDTPMVMGLLKPTILIPLACINHLSEKQMEAVLLHELAHIKRNDYVINLYIAMVEILFFFNPFTRMIIQTIKQERENSCDDWVLQFRFNRHQYASALLALEKKTGPLTTR